VHVHALCFDVKPPKDGKLWRCNACGSSSLRNGPRNSAVFVDPVVTSKKGRKQRKKDIIFKFLPYSSSKLCSSFVQTYLPENEIWMRKRKRMLGFITPSRSQLRGKVLIFRPRGFFVVESNAQPSESCPVKPFKSFSATLNFFLRLATSSGKVVAHLYSLN